MDSLSTDIFDFPSCKVYGLSGVKDTSSGSADWPIWAPANWQNKIKKG